MSLIGWVEAYILQRKREAITVASKEIGLEVNGERTKYIVMSRELNAQQNHILKTGNTDIPRFGVLPNCFLRYFEQIRCTVAQCPGAWVCARFHASVAKWTGIPLFWAIKQRVAVILYRSFGLVTSVRNNNYTLRFTPHCSMHYRVHHHRSTGRGGPAQSFASSSGGWTRSSRTKPRQIIAAQNHDSVLCYEWSSVIRGVTCV